MAINACTINGFTINSRSCRNKFDDLVIILHPPVVVNGTNPRVLRDGYAIPRPFDFEQPEERPTWTFEQPYISVSVEFLGTIGEQTLDSTQPQLDFVSVTNLTVVSASAPSNAEVSYPDVDSEVTVNIEDFKVL